LSAKSTAHLTERLTYCRRKFLSWLGKAGTLGAVLFAPKSRAKAGPETTELAEELNLAIGPKRLNSEPSEIFSEFMTARPGVQISYNQLFWPIHLQEGKLDQLTRLSGEALAAKAYKGKEFQLRILPALAHAHALGSPEPGAQVVYEDAVLRSLRSASSDRDALELLWRAMIAALIRNEDNWNTFSIGPDVLKEAASIIEAYLLGETVLFAPATLAWQFLLTYERAVRHRGQIQEIQRIQSLITGFDSLTDSSTFAWFAHLKRLFERRTSLAQMFPQASEVVMGHKFSPYGRRANHYFMAAHLERVFINSLYVGKKNRYVSSYWTEEIEKHSLRVLNAYGVTPADWHRIRSIALDRDLPLSTDAIAYWDKKYAGYDKVFASHAEQTSERAQATKLAQWVPFRTLDERKVVERTWSSNEDAFQIFSLFGLRGAWQKTVITEARRVAGPGIEENVILDAASEILDEKAKYYSDTVQEIADEAEILSAGFSGWTAETLSGKPVSEPSGAPQRSREAGAEGTPPTMEEAPMPYEYSTAASGSKPASTPRLMNASATPRDPSNNPAKPAQEEVPQTPLVGLRFDSIEGFKKAVDIYENGRFGRYLATAGRNTLIVPREELDWLQKVLRETASVYKLLPVRSLAQAPPEKAAQLRRRGGVKSEDLFVPQGHEVRIKRLKEKREEARQKTKPE
jgi:hypothetical protein